MQKHLQCVLLAETGKVWNHMCADPLLFTERYACVPVETVPGGCLWGQKWGGGATGLKKQL